MDCKVGKIYVADLDNKAKWLMRFIKYEDNKYYADCWCKLGDYNQLIKDSFSLGMVTPGFFDKITRPAYKEEVIEFAKLVVKHM